MSDAAVAFLDVSKGSVSFDFPDTLVPGKSCGDSKPSYPPEAAIPVQSSTFPERISVNDVLTVALTYPWQQLL